MKKIKVYIAGSCKNVSIVKAVMNDIETMGYEIAIDWTKHKRSGPAKLYADEDIKALQECDCLLYCMDGISSRGKNFELGYVTALGKPIAIYMPNLDSIAHIPIETPGILKYYIDKECIFIRANIYPIFYTTDELRSWLSNIQVWENYKDMKLRTG